MNSPEEPSPSSSPTSKAQCALKRLGDEYALVLAEHHRLSVAVLTELGPARHKQVLRARVRRFRSPRRLRSTRDSSAPTELRRASRRAVKIDCEPRLALERIWKAEATTSTASPKRTAEPSPSPPAPRAGSAS